MASVEHTQRGRRGAPDASGRRGAASYTGRRGQRGRLPSRGFSVFEIPVGGAAGAANAAGRVERRHHDRRRSGGEVRRRDSPGAGRAGRGRRGLRVGRVARGDGPGGAAVRGPRRGERHPRHQGRRRGGRFHPRLRYLPQLTRDEPFVRYNVYRLLDRKEVSLERGKPIPYPLVNGRTLQVTRPPRCDG